MNILHITHWYPNKYNPLEGVWIRRHIDSLEKHAEQAIWHIEIHPSERFGLHFCDRNSVRHRLIFIPTRRWFVIEIVNFLVLLYFFVVKRIHRNFDIINFHIAYPQLTYWFLLKKLIKKKVLITEHWSAYHFSFGTSKEKLGRVKKIFKQGIPVIAVSKALLNDIRIFSGNAEFEGYVVSNVVDSVFSQTNAKRLPFSFFMVSYWKAPKNPFVVLEAFKELCNQHALMKLRIGGDGPQLQAMKAFVSVAGLEENVKFLGTLSASEIAAEMGRAARFIHCSEYETFSVVCAEALCSGTPVIASKVGGITELVDETNGILCPENNSKSWLKAIHDSCKQNYDNASIAESAARKFSIDQVSTVYITALRSILYGNSK